MKEKIEELEKLYQDIDKLTPENMDKLIKESIEAFELIMAKMKSDKTEDKEEAEELAEKLRENLMNQAEKALNQLDLTKDELEAFSNNPDNFTEEEWHALLKAKEDLDSYQDKAFDEALTVEDVNNKQVKHKKKKPLWVAG